MKQLQTFKQEPYEAPVIEDCAPVTTLKGQETGGTDRVIGEDDEM